MAPETVLLGALLFMALLMVAAVIIERSEAEKRWGRERSGLLDRIQGPAAISGMRAAKTAKPEKPTPKPRAEVPLE